ncbi:MAG: hypothetical protein AUG45_00285 [Ktedonobacter sp. 13_1_20CM_3_54_15]|nr:MAG: hypothetical protein AUH05_21795 [Ktedonobacter sp. 13_2_20CM_53_11]OLB65573.1 MAG: hypothetical protein AUH94_00610 [Ktedonobacter sp. 13_2_20CM_2_54_8]OLE36046.1 MAG: hypothetical protein AUG45_00285 [Ktedonobacter sp. 13_1_20CM_3_54_15]TMC61227.1 MAG: hypothetical protein E6J21_08835 [Chloroflexota bacterium]TMD44098.1 MAG: hypothetical protein E6I90_10115 [Chloroflexota bacterium]
MELSLRLDTLEMVEMRYLRHRDRYRDWPSFQLLAASRQAKIMAYMTKDVAEQLHQQILIVESAVGLDEDEDGDELDEDSIDDEPKGSSEGAKSTERDSSTFSPAFAQALERLNDLARQRLPEGNIGSTGSKQPIQSGDVTAESNEVSGDDDDALEQLQDAFVQMMEVVRELAEELSTDALKISGRFRCARTNIEFIQAVSEADEEDDEEMAEESESGVMEVEVEVELVMVLQLFEEGRARPDDLPVVELQLDVDDFERLHETLDFALQQEERSRRRK